MRPEAPQSRAALTPAARQAQLLAWYRERDHDAENLHRRYVRAKFGMGEWSDADLARYHQYRRSVSREQAALLVITRRYLMRGLTATALAALIAGLIYAAYVWWTRKRRVQVRITDGAKSKPADAARPKSG